MGMSSRPEKLEDLPSVIPLFPLLGAILLPRAILPLHIFEPRYLAMVDAALGGDRMIGIIQPDGEAGPTGSPMGRSSPLCRVGCVGRINSFQEIDGGRYVIALSGVARFTPVRELHDERPYRTFEVDYGPWARDLEPGYGEDDIDRDRLVDVLTKFLTHRRLQADWAAIGKSGNEILVNALSVASPFVPAEKQALLEAGTLAQRAATLITLAEMELASSGGDDGADKPIQ